MKYRLLINTTRIYVNMSLVDQTKLENAQYELQHIFLFISKKGKIS